MDKTPGPDWASAWLKPRHFHPHCPQEAHPRVPREQADACGEASPGAAQGLQLRAGLQGLGRGVSWLLVPPTAGSFPPATARGHLLSQVLGCGRPGTCKRFWWVVLAIKSGPIGSSFQGLRGG